VHTRIEYCLSIFGQSFLLSKVIDTLLFIFTFIVFLASPPDVLAIIAYMPLVLVRGDAQGGWAEGERQGEGRRRIQCREIRINGVHDYLCRVTERQTDGRSVARSEEQTY